MMSSQNRGKDFENVIKKAFKRFSDVSIDRLHDQTTGYAGSSNICDFIVYKRPNQYYIECKSTGGKSLPLTRIINYLYSWAQNYEFKGKSVVRKSLF